MSTEKIILPNTWSIQEGQNLLVTKIFTEKFDYAEVEISDEKQFFFEAHGMQFRLSVGEHGFTLWDNTEGQWILDASTLGYTTRFTFGKNDFLKGVVIEPSKDKLGDFEIRPKVVIDLEAAEHKMHPTLGESAASDSESTPAPKRVI